MNEMTVDGAEANARTRRRLPLWVVLIGMLAAGLCALLALNTASAALEVQTRGVSDTNANTSDTQQQLTRDLAAKAAPGNLASAAAALGLVPNQNPAFLRINNNGSVTVLGSPTPATAPPLPPKPKPTPKPTPTPSKSAKPSASAKPKPGTTVTVTVTKSASPGASKPTAKSSVAKSAVAKSSPAKPKASASTTAGGH